MLFWNILVFMIDKTTAKRQLLLERTALALDIDEAMAEEVMGRERKSSFRINRLKCSDTEKLLADLALQGWNGSRCDWYEDGYDIKDGRQALISSSHVANGEIFIQNQASWLPVLALDPQPDERILDMCAAPGGKASHIAALTNNKAELWTNDSSRQRLFKLKSNFERLGVQASKITMYSAEKLAQKLEGETFDKILLDAPCSGEGLININKPKDLQYWSRPHIKRLQSLQKKLIMNAWSLLSPGGILVYSTCTMAPEENEAVVDYLLRRAENAEVVEMKITPENAVAPVMQWNNKQYDTRINSTLRLAPASKIEAFYVAKLTKSDTHA